MPEVRFHLEGEAPDGPHLALLTGEEGLWTAIPRGAVMAVIEDPLRIDKVFPLVLAKVSLKKLIFRCMCSDTSCTKHYEYSLTQRGFHQPGKKATGVSSPTQGPTVLNAPSQKKGSR